MKIKFFKKIVALAFVLVIFIYGFMIGKYRVFPYSLAVTFDNLQNFEGYLVKFDEEFNETIQQGKYLESNEYYNVNYSKLISVNNKDDVDKYRTISRRIIFGKDILPNTLPTKITDNYKNDYGSLENLLKVQELEIELDYGIKSNCHLFLPKKSNGKALIYHQGHRGGFDLGVKTIGYFVNKGFTVFALAMPLTGLNERLYEIPHNKLGNITISSHEDFKYLEHPLKFFIEPTIAVINFISSRFNFKALSMVGISGGGWTTVLAAAVDTRIKNSFSVSGSIPLYIRFYNKRKDYGDFEQMFPKLFSKVNYLDLYLLGAIGKSRSSIQVVITNDPCCFGGDKFSHYSGLISQIAIKNEGTFRVVVDESTEKHEISDFTLDTIDNIIMEKEN